PGIIPGITPGGTPGCTPGGTWITAQNSDTARELSKVSQRVADPCIGGMSDEVQIETVLPRPADKRSRFNLGEINVAQSEDSHRAVERARLVLEREDDRGLVCAGWRLSC